ncbi:hypothetical protein F5050DRAFT_1717559 [Lentinula boryana]|uniref:Mitochondrial carrier n=1 Tax=Lentinula boryana TaxID=40481 RepID=A0ABQ8QVN7_9AGAR|nr:hypothetical protein F5050DRAFT_1717559 [Lentinula boryana]
MPSSPTTSPSFSRSSSQGATAITTGIQLDHDADVLIQTYIPAISNANAPPYRQDDVPQILPLCIPRISVNANPASAFARGYNEALESVGITQEMFLSFIDGLNLAIVASPPLRVVNAVGQIIGFVPNHWTMVASMIVTTSAQVGMRVLSKSLTDRYLRAANLNLFKPHGLSVRLCTTPAMLRLVAPPGSYSDADESKTRATMNKIGRGVGTIFLKLPIPVVAPIAARIIHSLADKPPPIAPSPYFNPGSPNQAQSPVLMRRLALLEHTFPGATLSVQIQGLPPPAKPKGVMEMINTWGLKFDEKKETKAERKNEERRRARAQIQAAGVANGEYPYGLGGYRGVPRSPSPLPSPLAMPTPMISGAAMRMDYGGNSGGYMDHRAAKREVKREVKAAKREVKAVKREAKAERKAYRRMQKAQRRGLLSGMSKTERRAAAADLLEHWATNRVLWVVVMPAEKDEVIANIEIAEDSANEEQVDEETWRMAMKLEEDQMEDDTESEEEWDEELEEEGDESQHVSSSHLQPPKQ